MKRMKALGVVEWHLTRRQAIYYLLSIGMPTRGARSLYEGLSPLYDGFFHDVYGSVFFSNSS